MRQNTTAAFIPIFTFNILVPVGIGLNSAIYLRLDYSGSSTLILMLEYHFETFSISTSDSI